MTTKHKQALDAQPVAWVAADTLHSPHPACVSSLAYVSQLDKDRGREYVPLYAAPVAASSAMSAQGEGDDDCAWCSECGVKLETVRPGKHQHPICSQAIDALEAARKDAWQPIETAPKPDIGANGFGKRLLLAVVCGDGTTQSVRRGFWEGTDWYLDCCMGLATDYGYRVTHWRPLPAPPAIDEAMGKE